MAKKKTEPNALIITNLAIKGIQDKKGFDICSIDLRNVSNAICDFFVVCSGSSDTNVKAIADGVEDEIRKIAGEKPIHIEGKAVGEWVLLDYFNVIVHIFQRDKRAFYNLEELWADGKIDCLEETMERDEY